MASELFFPLRNGRKNRITSPATISSEIREMVAFFRNIGAMFSIFTLNGTVAKLAEYAKIKNRMGVPNRFLYLFSASTRRKQKVAAMDFAN